MSAPPSLVPPPSSTTLAVHDALRQSEERYRTVTNSVCDVIFACDAAGAFTFLNVAWAEITGHAVSASVGKSCVDFVHPAESAAFSRRLGALLRGETVELRETWRVITASRGCRWFLLHARPTREEAKVIGGAGTLTDITERHMHAVVANISRLLDRLVPEGPKPDRLLREVCAATVAGLGLPLGWVGRHLPDGRVRVLAQAGALLAQQKPNEELRWDDAPRGGGPIARALHTGLTQLARRPGIGSFPWRTSADELGVEAVVAAPLFEEKETFGVLVLYTALEGGFGPAERSAIELLASRISMALQLAAQQSHSAPHSAAMATSSTAHFITNRAGTIEWVNDAFTRMTGFQREEAVGATPKLLQSGKHPPEFYRQLWETVLSGEMYRGELINRTKYGGLYTAAMTITPLLSKEGEISHFLASQEDITSRREGEAQASRLSYQDPLTALPNRVRFQSNLATAIEQTVRLGRLLGVLFLDLDRFKLINDTMGHGAGDALLREVARRLKSCVRDEDAVARLGGDEFTLVLSDLADAGAAAIVAQRILRALSRPFGIDGRQVHTSASIGITLCPVDGKTVDALIKQADTAMYRAKERGRDGYAFFTAEMHSQVEKRVFLEDGLRHALDRREFVLHYQPQVDIERGRIFGLEALLRWERPSTGLVSPGEFIPVAEETGLIVPIGEWTLHTTCMQLRHWEEAGIIIPRVAVNVSAVQFRQPNIVQVVSAALKETRVDAHRLEIELTEGVVMHDAKAVIATLDELRELGVRVSLDDFGTGYSSLSYLKRFPIDTLKIDQSFVRGLPENVHDAAITQLIIAMAQSLRLQVVAEGVETPEQLEFLRAHGCDYIQGYFFSRPLTAANLAAFVTDPERCALTFEDGKRLPVIVGSPQDSGGWHAIIPSPPGELLR